MTIYSMRIKCVSRDSRHSRRPAGSPGSPGDGRPGAPPCGRARRHRRRLCEEVHLNLAYRWFCRLGLDGQVPGHSTFSKNRHGRFRESDLLRLRADAEAVTHDQHPDHQLRIDRRAHHGAVERRELTSHLRQVDEAVDRPQQMIARHMRIEREAIKQRTLFDLPRPHHRLSSCLSTALNQ